jgi:hypothetical protein
MDDSFEDRGSAALRGLKKYPIGTIESVSAASVAVAHPHDRWKGG